MEPVLCPAEYYGPVVGPAVVSVIGRAIRWLCAVVCFLPLYTVRAVGVAVNVGRVLVSVLLDILPRTLADFLWFGNCVDALQSAYMLISLFMPSHHLQPPHNQITDM